MAHVRALVSAGRSSSQKKIPRLVPPLIITVRILVCISTSLPDTPYAQVERLIIYPSIVHPDESAALPESHVTQAQLLICSCFWLHHELVLWHQAWDLGCLPALVDHNDALERNDHLAVLVIAAGLHRHDANIKARPRLPLRKH